MSHAIIRGDARRLPLPDGSVDLVATSPPYWALRSYTDAGEHYGGQIGSEGTPQEFVAAMVECVAEMARVLKPAGSIFLNLGDKYATAAGPKTGEKSPGLRTNANGHAGGPKWAITERGAAAAGFREKSLLGLPWRVALACTDQLGLILRAEIIWAKPNGLPESVTDRVRRAHEQVFHFTKQPRYYAAVDEIREPQDYPNHGQLGKDPRGDKLVRMPDGHHGRPSVRALNPLGKLPGSVWTIPSAPLTVPARLGVDHFAAFPPALVRPLVLGWSPPGICTECGEGRWPVSTSAIVPDKRHNGSGRQFNPASGNVGVLGRDRLYAITGYVCACAPYTDHPERRGKSWHPHDADGTRGARTTEPQRPSGPRESPREYHLDGWTPPPTRPAVVLDPFGGTGTTALVATVHGRHGITVDMSADYCRLAAWRVHDPGERARALDVPKPPPIPDGQDHLFGVDELLDGTTGG